MESSLAVSAAGPNRPTFSCVRCADRKVKCDRQLPCSACVRHKAECIFRPPRPPRRRQKLAADQHIQSQLKHYETLLKENGIDPNSMAQDASLSKTTSSDHGVLDVSTSGLNDDNDSVPKAELLHDQERSKIVDNTLWARIAEEQRETGAPFENSIHDDAVSDASEDDFGFVLGGSSGWKHTLQHPATNDIFTLWQVFIDNVDPVLKLVHVPTLDGVVRRAALNTQALPKELEALMFAIYGVAVTTLTDEECSQKFSLSRSRLLAHYVKSTRAALSATNFMGTSSVVVLQGLILHIITLRELCEPLVIWTLTGVALRLADSIGLNRNGESLGLSPFESEVRRRIWWQLKMHDNRTAELSGMAKFKDMDNPYEVLAPLNVNDTELYPSMPKLPAERPGLTDVVFIVLRSDLMRFAMTSPVGRGLRKANSMLFDHKPSKFEMKERDEAIDQLESQIEAKYLRYCDPSQPLHLFVLLIARYGMNTARFHAHHPRGWSHSTEVSEEERQKIWELSLKQLEQSNMLQTSSLLRRFAWNAPYYLPWAALIHVLDVLRMHSSTSGSNRAWQLLAATYKNNPDLVSNTRKAIYVAVGNLCLKAFSVHEKALLESGLLGHEVPQFIADLRQQRQMARARRAERDSRKFDQTAKPGSQPRSTRISSPQRTTASAVANPAATSLPDEPSFIGWSGPPQAGHQTGVIHDPASLDIKGLLKPFENVIADMDIDFMLEHTPGSQEIDWSQWDSWLKDADVDMANTNANLSTNFGWPEHGEMAVFPPSEPADGY